MGGRLVDGQANFLEAVDIQNVSPDIAVGVVMRKYWNHLKESKSYWIKRHVNTAGDILNPTLWE